MQTVSNEFLTAMHQPITKPVLKGTVGGTKFTGSDILEGSFRISNQCVSSTDICLGGVYVGELELTFLSSIANTRGVWTGRTIKVEYGLELADGTYEYVKCPSGSYTISEATWTDSGLKVVAYDNMVNLDADYSNEQSTGTPYEWLSFISKKTSVGIENTEAEIEAMPNGTSSISLYSTNDIKTYRDVLANLSEVLGGFATISRNGKIEIRQFNGSVVDTISASGRFSGCSFSDFTTKYTGISVTNTDDNSTSYYHMSPDDGLTMNVGENPFLQYGIDTTVKEMRTNVLNSLKTFEYVPFSASLLGCCVYDLGDLIDFTGGIANGSVGCIMSFDFGLSSYTVAGYGENPSLESVQSKQDKNISGIKSSQSEEQLAVTSLTNVAEVSVSDEWQTLGSVNFSVSKDQTICFHAVAKLNLTTSGSVNFKYLLNSSELDFVHTEQMPYGIDTATLFIPFPVESGTRYSLKVLVESDDAVGTVESLNLRGAILGMGINIADWDGNIEIDDIYNSLIFDKGISIPYKDGEVITWLDSPNQISGLTDSYSLSMNGGMTINYSDTDFEITTSTNTYTRYLEGSSDVRTNEAQNMVRVTKGGYEE